MRKLGFAVLIIGLLAVVIAMNMNVSVDSGAGPVVSIGLMKLRQQLTISSGVLALGGLLIILFSQRKSGD